MELKINIFFIDRDPVIAAQYSVDRHVVKMILETAQLLSTAHHVLDGSSAPEDIYKVTHVNHPSAVWARSSRAAYDWLYRHFIALLDEYTYRYGKIHKTSRLREILSNPPLNISERPWIEPTPAMDDLYIIRGDVLASYRNYYKYGKAHLHKYTRRDMPDFLKDN